MGTKDKDGFSVDDLGYIEEAALEDGALTDDTTNYTFTSPQLHAFAKRMLGGGATHSAKYQHLQTDIRSTKSIGAGSRDLLLSQRQACAQAAYEIYAGVFGPNHPSTILPWGDLMQHQRNVWTSIAEAVMSEADLQLAGGVDQAVSEALIREREGNIHYHRREDRAWRKTTEQGGGPAFDRAVKDHKRKQGEAGRRLGMISDNGYRRRTADQGSFLSRAQDKPEELTEHRTGIQPDNGERRRVDDPKGGTAEAINKTLDYWRNMVANQHKRVMPTFGHFYDTCYRDDGKPVTPEKLAVAFTEYVDKYLHAYVLARIGDAITEGFTKAINFTID